MSSATDQMFLGVKQLPHKFLADGMYFGESSCFHNGMLYVSDMTGCRIYTIDTSSGEKQVLLEIENQPNGMCFAADGSPIYSSMFDAKLYQFSDGKSELYAETS
ncbi:lactone hydrolase protein [Penicillium atrosanguineum]|uniref:Lactone hydrolase protein n=1 Tax=Penicillium atrosanguineum TaxID=1132637 RepID=A0A9W9KTS7_9EURO|nr:Phosphate-repressible acid phosphatase [Penicillium atrosanguineum]KAJ5118415.1 lactone hydrolase protein [Penicillium atrosanguineum]KAJ5119454.1 lactone hydrolase protein [Penicillium atrosanguineum]KAJ5296452.1 Phosphate-repressible acid phosphatase [Penicillium atrosanguineum]KAJ5299220.1 lactone hydrolase protein [Penicillium atrosanguineum]